MVKGVGRMQIAEKRSIFRGVSALLAAAMAAGCASDNIAALREQPSFHVGFGDGCATSREEDKSFSTKSTRDKHAFDNDEAYRAGWRQGWLECGNARTPDAIDGGRILGERNEY